MQKHSSNYSAKSENAQLSNYTTFPRTDSETKKSPIVTADEDKKIEKIKKRTQENKTQEFMIIR